MMTIDTTQELRNALWTATYRSLLALMCVLGAVLFLSGFSVAWTLEFLFFLAVFDYFESSELAVANWVKAVISAVAVVAFHFAIERLRNSRSGAVDLERRIAVWMVALVILFLVGAGMMLSAILSDQGLLDIGDPSAGIPLPDLGQQIVEATGRPWLVDAYKAYVLPLFPVVFALALVATLLLTAFVAHCCLMGFLTSVRMAIRARSTARTIRQEVATFFNSDRIRRAQNREAENIPDKREASTLANRFHVKCASAIGAIQAVVDVREHEPDKTYELRAERRNRDIPDFWFVLPINEARQRLEALKKRTSLERIEAALEGSRS